MYYLCECAGSYTSAQRGSMRRTDKVRKLSRRTVTAVCAVFLLSGGCRNSSLPIIAVIPRTSGTPLWEPVHVGAEIAAHRTGTKIYWNAPTREDDAQGQIALVESVIDRRFQGLVLAPDQVLALITPVQRALSKGTPTVIIGSPLPIPPGGRLTYILNDEVEAGHMAALRVGHLLGGKGSIAVLGVNPDIAGIMVRVRSLEEALARLYPDIKIVEKRFGSFNAPHDQLIAEETLRANLDLNAIVALTSASTRESCSALAHSGHKESIKVIGFDEPDPMLFREGSNLDSMIIPNSREMGIKAVTTIAAQLRGQTVPAEVKLKPVLVTSGNLDSPEVLQVRSMEWWLP
jgi:ribose transport system substrate-binding protein